MKNTVKNREVYAQDPGTLQLLNNGVAEVTEVDSDALRRTLRFELQTFVCESEYEKGLEKILETFLRNLGQPEQPGVWVSGFYGCGKSILVKMLRYLWADYQFPDQATARGLVRLPKEIKDLLKELSTRGKQFGGLHAASGKLGAGAGDSIRLAALSIVFASAGLPRDYAQARFVIWLKQNGYYDMVRQQVEAQGKTLDQELRHLYASPHIAQGLLNADPNFAPSVKEVRSLIKAQFSTPADITDDEMLAVMRDVLVGTDGNVPCTLLVFDEVQQYIGDSPERGRQVYEIAEAIEKHLDGRVLLVGTGQSALTDTPLLQKNAGRFQVKIHLSDTDVETVTRKMLLLKKPDRLAAVNQTVDTCGGEISRHLRQAHEAFRQTHEQELQRLAESEPWTRLPDDQRRYILRQHGTGTVPEIRVGTESEVMATLGKMPLGTWHDQRDALPTRFDKARLEAARRLEPQAVSVKLPAATIKTPEDLDLWLDAIRDKILERLKEGPVIVN